MRALVDLLKKVPIDLGQGAVAEYTEGKQIAKRLTPDGASRTALDLGARYGAQSRWLEARYEVTSSISSQNLTNAFIWMRMSPYLSTMKASTLFGARR